MESAALTSTGRLRLIRILHDPQTLLHHSVELIAHTLIPAYESRDRVTMDPGRSPRREFR
jgi:hypothetical protein